MICKDGKLSNMSLERRNNTGTNMLRSNVWFNNLDILRVSIDDADRRYLEYRKFLNQSIFAGLLEIFAGCAGANNSVFDLKILTLTTLNTCSIHSFRPPA